MMYKKFGNKSVRLYADLNIQLIPKDVFFSGTQPQCYILVHFFTTLSDVECENLFLFFPDTRRWLTYIYVFLMCCTYQKYILLKSVNLSKTLCIVQYPKIAAFQIMITIMQLGDVNNKATKYYLVFWLVLILYKHIQCWCVWHVQKSTRKLFHRIQIWICFPL
jgi:hypothetical protein